MIPFNKPYLSGKELSYIQEAASLGQLSGDGHFTKLSKEWLDNYYTPSQTLLTHSCTAALEIALKPDVQAYITTQQGSLLVEAVT